MTAYEITSPGLTISPNPTTFGQAVTLTATVTPVTSGGPTPTGKVTFRYLSAKSGFATVALGSDGVAARAGPFAAGRCRLAGQLAGGGRDVSRVDAGRVQELGARS